MSIFNWCYSKTPESPSTWFSESIDVIRRSTRVFAFCINPISSLWSSNSTTVAHASLLPLGLSNFYLTTSRFPKLFEERKQLSSEGQSLYYNNIALINHAIGTLISSAHTTLGTLFQCDEPFLQSKQNLFITLGISYIVGSSFGLASSLPKHASIQRLREELQGGDLKDLQEKIVQLLPSCKDISQDKATLDRALYSEMLKLKLDSCVSIFYLIGSIAFLTTCFESDETALLGLNMLSASLFSIAEGALLTLDSKTLCLALENLLYSSPCDHTSETETTSNTSGSSDV